MTGATQVRKNGRCSSKQFIPNLSGRTARSKVSLQVLPALSGSGQNVGLSHVPGELKGLLWNITIIFKRYMC